MRRYAIFALVSALLAAGALARTSSARAVEVGGRAPDIGLRDFDGRMVRLSSYRGKVLIVDVWASWCGPCAQEMPALQRLYARYRRQGLRVVGISVDRDEAAARRFMERTNVRFRNVHDPETSVPPRYGLSTMPTSWIIDHRGIVRHVTSGFRSSDAAEMERVVRRLLAALPSAPQDPPRGEAAIAENAQEPDDEAPIEDEPTEPAATADAPPPAGRSDAGRSGGLCSVRAPSSPQPLVALLIVGLVALVRAPSRGRRSPRGRPRPRRSDADLRG